MRTLTAVLVAGLLLTSYGSVARTTETVAFTNVSVVPMDSNRVVADQTVIVAADRIGNHFKSTDAFGTVAVGKRADLILVEGNPLEDLANIERRSGVMVRGRWLPRSDIQTRLD